MADHVDAEFGEYAPPLTVLEIVGSEEEMTEDGLEEDTEPIFHAAYPRRWRDNE